MQGVEERAVGLLLGLTSACTRQDIGEFWRHWDGSVRVAQTLLLTIALLTCWRNPGVADFWRRPGMDSAPHIAAACSDVVYEKECAARVDSILLAGNDMVWRTARGLHIRVQADSVVVLRDHRCDCESAESHYYLGLFEEIQSHVVFVSGYETLSYVLVHSSSGDSTHLQAFPVISPNHVRFITASADLHAGFLPNELQIWTIAEGVARLEWNLRPGWDLEHPDSTVMRWGPVFPAWTDPNTVTVVAEAYMWESRRDSLLPGRLVFHRSSAGWAFVGESR